jgi:hypothetical protein
LGQLNRAWTGGIRSSEMEKLDEQAGQANV